MTEVQTTETMTHSNPYAQQVLAQGRDLSKAPAPKAQYPRTIYGRTFETEADYREAVAEMLNGMWQSGGCPPMPSILPTLCL